LESEIYSTSKMMETERHKNQDEINSLKTEVEKWKKLSNELNNDIKKHDNEDNNNQGTYDLLNFDTPNNKDNDYYKFEFNQDDLLNKINENT